MPWQPLKALECGRYDEIRKHLETKKTLSANETLALLGSYSFLGRLDEAVELWQLHKSELSPELKIRCRFFLGIATTRTARFKQGRFFFKANLQDQAKAGGALAYIYQGIGFYFYYVGQFAKAKQWSRKALRAALEKDDAYLRFLSMDLLGHSLVQIGSRSEGIHLIRLAKELAEKHGNPHFAAAFDSSSIVYESEVGWHARETASILRQRLAHLLTQDTYSRANIALELARQLSLAGQWQAAKELLNTESQSIYEFGHRRQELTLQLRLAEIAYRQGDRFTSEHFLRAARRCLNDIADRAFEIKVLGLEIKLKELAANEVPVELKDRLMHLSVQHSSLINKQVLFRKGWVPDPKTSQVEDPIHHLFLLAQSHPQQAAERAREAGYFGLWAEFAQMAPGTHHFFFSEKSWTVLLCGPEGITQKNESHSNQNLKLLQYLRYGPINKENLIRSLWGYDYHPLRHDPLIHTAISKVRKLLEPYSHWIVTSENGWHLNPQVHWHLPQPVTELPVAAIPLPSSPNESFNFRQRQALSIPLAKGFWSIQSYKEEFAVSTMTAWRDLKALCQSGHLISSGKGRATRYHRADLTAKAPSVSQSGPEKASDS